MASFGPLGMPRVHDRRHIDPVVEGLLYKFPEVASSKYAAGPQVSSSASSPSTATVVDSNTMSTAEKNGKRSTSAEKNIDCDVYSVQSSSTSSTLVSLKNKFRKSFSSH
ncbi:hypothetical protein HOO65_020242 [Ceratocystis lukuohia]|uniref:Uncharacterized protein n=1 Tax=Ceratocystis lukuohia TaxID=2019550 RepID=A0ABR4MN76_9PEZI